MHMLLAAHSRNHIPPNVLHQELLQPRSCSSVGNFAAFLALAGLSGATPGLEQLLVEHVTVQNFESRLQPSTIVADPVSPHHAVRLYDVCMHLHTPLSFAMLVRREAPRRSSSSPLYAAMVSRCATATLMQLKLRYDSDISSIYRAKR